MPLSMVQPNPYGTCVYCSYDIDSTSDTDSVYSQSLHSKSQRHKKSLFNCSNPTLPEPLNSGLMIYIYFAKGISHI